MCITNAAPIRYIQKPLQNVTSLLVKGFKSLVKVAFAPVVFAEIFLVKVLDGLVFILHKILMPLKGVILTPLFMIAKWIQSVFVATFTSLGKWLLSFGKSKKAQAEINKSEATTVAESKPESKPQSKPNPETQRHDPHQDHPEDHPLSCRRRRFGLGI